MAVLPGSLDYLYYNGIIDRIPYEAYEIMPMTPSGMAQMSGAGMCMGAGSYGMMPAMNGTQYLQAAQRGLIYNTYTCPDTFINRDISDEVDSCSNNQRGKSFKDSIKDTYAKAYNTYSTTPGWVKGLLATGITLLTLAALIKGIRRPHK